MSDYEKLYNSPETQIIPDRKQIAGGLTESMLQYLKEASPWLRFIGILGFIGSGLSVLFGIIISVFSSIVASEITGTFGNAPVWLVMIFYIAVGAVAFFPARFTYNFGAMIKKYQFSNSDEDLETAFKNNKSLWKFNGIMAIIVLSLTPAMIIIFVLFGLLTAFQFF